ncbi:hypothetical protein SLEP1_g13394 [Rubroshorea leprosula]|uniref:Uncharacterized protein n=1 Tax=Rubroshorea leprosula TaxID=152421 RepID=A0AAV5IFR1_9ROSI|nr:hypothetical protein SLEP1_g13394 [Rubroshorea leprosula]
MSILGLKLHITRSALTLLLNEKCGNWGHMGEWLICSII